MRTLSCLLTSILLTCLVFGLQAQQCYPVYINKYGGSGSDEARFTIRTADGGAVVAGRTTSSTNGKYDAFLLKLSDNGIVTWSKNYGFAENDEFTKIRAAKDGGYIILGSVALTGNLSAEPVLIRTDAAGNAIWSRKLVNSPTGRDRATDLIELQDGSIGVIVNTNDSTSLANGLILNFSSTGSLQWSRSFDRGGMDRLECIIQKGETLLVGGQTEQPGGRKSGLVLHLNATDGKLIKGRLVHKGAQPGNFYFDSNIIMLSNLDNDGLAFSMIYNYPTEVSPDLNNNVVHVKLDKNEKAFFSSTNYGSSGSGEKSRPHTIMVTADSGFASFSSMREGAPLLQQFATNGIDEMGRKKELDFWHESFAGGMDTLPDRGFLFAVSYRNANWNGSPNFKIEVSKTNQLGRSGDCNYRQQLSFFDTANVLINNLVNVNLAPASEASGVSVPVDFKSNDITLMENCQSTYCMTQPAFPEQCNSSFLVKLKGEAKVQVYDTERLPDGGMLSVGTLRYYSNTYPLVTRLKPNGEVLWSRSYTSYLQMGIFRQIIPAGDGTFLAVANESATVNHGVSSISKLFKLNANGDVLWVKQFDFRYDIDIYDLQVLPDGGWVFIANNGYGSGGLTNLVVRMDKQGNIIWKKQGEFWPSSAVYKKLLIDGNDIYIASDFYYLSSRFRLEKIDLVTGKLVWQKVENVEGVSFLYVGSITRSGNELAVGLQLFSQNPTYYFDEINVALVHYSLDGVRKPEALKIVQPAYFFNWFFRDWSDHVPGNMITTTDGNIAYAQQSHENNVRALTIMKMTPTGKLIWSSKFENYGNVVVWGLKNDGDNLIVTGIYNRTSDDDLAKDNSFIMVVDGSGKISVNATGECKQVTGAFSTAPMGGIENEFLQNDQYENASDLELSVPTVITYPRKLVSTLACQETVTCNSLTASGEEKICDASLIYRYDAVRNAECTAPVSWLFDQSAAEAIETGDDFIRIRFKKAGDFSLKTTIRSGCSLLESTVNINVALPATTFTLGADTTICDNKPLLLTALPGMLSYEWQDKSTADRFLVTNSGQYYVTSKDACGRSISDTIQVLMPQVPPISLGNDTAFCSGNNIILDAGAGYVAYTWNNGETTRQVSVSRKGMFVVKARHTSGCEVSDTLHVTDVFAKPAMMLNVPDLCEASVVTMRPNAVFNAYKWNDGSSLDHLDVSATGKYWLTITDHNGCTTADTVTINNIYPNPAGFLIADTAVCNRRQILLSPLKSFAAYQWSNGTTSSDINVGQPGEYWLRVTDSHGCSGSDSVVVRSKECLSGLYVPNAFTPNGDRKNDVFKPVISGVLLFYRFSIYNRFGQEVFSTSDPNAGWDGTLQGLKNDSNTFTWKCNYQFEGEKPTHTSGIVVMIR